MTGPELEGALRAYFKEHFPHGHVEINLFPSGGMLVVTQYEDSGTAEDRVFSASWGLKYGETMADAVQRVKEQI